MYQVNEKKLDILLCESTSLLDRIHHSGKVTNSEVQHFGDALLAVQTEIHRQSTVIDNGLYKEKVKSVQV